MRRGTFRVRSVLVSGHDSPLTSLNEVVTAMNGDHKVVNVMLQGGQSGTFNGRAHRDGESVVMSENHEGTRATLTQTRRGLQLKVG